MSWERAVSRQVHGASCADVAGARILIVGVSYKRDIGDVRESPALDIIERLRARGARIEYSDPFVPELRVGGDRLASVALLSSAGGCDCAVIVTDHSSVNYAALLALAPLVVDTRNATRGLRGDHAGKIVAL